MAVQAAERKYFGTDGIRGVANNPPLDPETLVRLGRAVAHVFQGKKGRRRIIIAKDTRLSGYMIEFSLTAGITSMGADVQLCGPLPTPGLAYLTRSMRADAGIMISASHNPYEDNGIKIFGGDGFKLADRLESKIEELIQPGSLDAHTAAADDVGKAFRIADHIGRYIVFLKSFVPRTVNFEGLKVGIDCANGAGYAVGPQCLQELGIEVISRGVSPSGRNINAGFGSLYPEVVRKVVVDQKLDLGIALDGDADRCILVDEKGNVLDGDAILAIIALDRKKRGLLKQNAVVATVMSNLGLEKLLGDHDIKLIRAKVGDRYVLEEMQRTGCEIGGEQSGHTIFLEHQTTGDGLLTALGVLEVMAREQKTLSQLAAPFVRYPQRIVNVKVNRKPALDSVPAIRDVIAATDKDLKNRGRLLVRYSGTENKARVMVECDDDTLCEAYADRVAEVLQRELGAAA